MDKIQLDTEFECPSKFNIIEGKHMNLRLKKKSENYQRY